MTNSHIGAKILRHILITALSGEIQNDHFRFRLRFINPGGLVGISATLQVMLGGIGLAFLYEKSGSLWPSIYFHSVNNVIGILQVLAPR